MTSLIISLRIICAIPGKVDEVVEGGQADKVGVKVGSIVIQCNRTKVHIIWICRRHRYR